MYDFYLFEELAEVMGAFLALYGIIFSVFSCAGIVLFILQGIGLYDMSKEAGLKYAWLSFIPCIWPFSLGRIAQRYVKRDGKPSAKFSVWLIVLNVLQILTVIAFLAAIVFAVFAIVANAQNSAELDTAMTIEMFKSLIPAIILYFVLFAAALAYNITYYVALWRIFATYDNSNATLFIVLSIFFNFLAPIFIFVLRKKPAKITYSERMGFEQKEIIE